jgi:DNA polymerase-3 subunit epsilon
MGLEKTRGECFAVQLRKCRGACGAREDTTAYNDRFMSAFEHSRLTAWPYPGPILITERHSQLEGSEGIVVDQWCLRGRLREYDSGEIEHQRLGHDFDLDTYKILQAHLQDPRRRVQLRHLPAGYLAALEQ